MEKFIVVLSQRRLWAFVVSIVAFTVNALNSNYNVDVPVLTDLLTSIGGALAMLIPGLLALWSYIQPKK